MVEELKLAIKVDDDEIEQSLLKQFANAEKMANKVVLTFNNIDLDDKAIEAKFKEMQKMAGKNPIDLSIDKSSIEMLSAISKQLGNIFDIAKGKSIIDSSAIDNDAIKTTISLFEKIESSITAIRKVFVDVGDGEEFSPLLKMINNVQSSISELATSVKGIGLNMNIDVGSNSEMEAKVQSKIANALQAYQRLFDHIKMSSAGGQIITDKFFDFDINQYDTMMGKLQAYKKFIDNMRKEAKAQFNGQDVLYQDTEKSYWTQASAAMGQVTKAFNEMNVASDTNPLADMFGKADLSEVIEQLGLIVAKLEEISNTASSFKNVFDNGFNVTTSVEEIDKLTNRVKELEDELSKIKLNPVNVDKSNISSENSIVEGQNKIQEELKETENTIKKVYRAYNKMSGMVGEAGISWFSDDLDTMKTYMNHYKDRELVSGDIDINKLLSIDAQGSKHNAITYLGDYSDEASIKITNLYNRIQELKSELSKAPNDALAQQLKELELEYDKLSEDTSNLYGTHTTNWFAIQAKEAGYLGIAIKNVIDDYNGLIDKPTTTIALFDTNLLENQEKITSKIRENVENIKGLNFDVSKAVETDANSFVNNISPEDLDDEIREIQEFSSLMKLTQMTSEELSSSLREVFSYAHENPDVLDNLYDYNPNLVDVFDKNTNIGKYFDELVSSTNWDVDESSLESIYLDFAKKLQDYENKYIESVKQKLNIISNNIQSDNTYTEETISSNNSIQNELKETQKQAEETSKAILKVTAYRGTNGGDPVTSNKSGATFWDSKKNVANMYGTNSSDKTLWSSELSFNNPLVIDAKKQKYGNISYLGDGADKASKAILELTKRENQLRESLEKSTKSGLEEVAMAYELQDVCRQIKKISDDTSNPYGTHSSDWFAEYAKNNGYDGLHIKNVLDTPDSYAKNGTEVSDVFATFQREQLENTVLLAKANKDLAESEREVALAELGVTKNSKENSENSLENKIKEIFTDTNELKKVLDSLHNGSYFSFGYEENDGVISRIRELIDLLKEYGYTVKNFKDDTEAFSVSGAIVENPIKDVFQGDDKVNTDASTTAIKEESQALEQVSTSAKDAASSKEKFAKANKEVKASADSSKTSISEEEKYFNSLGKSLTQYQNTLTSISRKPADGNRSQELQEKIDIISSSIEKLNALKSKTEENGYIFNKNDVDTGKQLEEIIKKNIELVKQMSSAQKGSDSLSRGKEIDTITKYLNKFTGISKQAKRELNGLLDQLQSGDPSVNVKKIHERFLELTVAERNAGREARNLFDIFKDKKIYSFLGQAASMFSFYDLIRYGREGIDTIREFDDGLTKISYTMDITKSQLNDLGKSVLDMANDLDSSINNAMQVSQIYANMNTSAEEIKKLSEPTLILSNLTGFDASTVADDIQAVTQQFDIAAESSMHIADVYDQISRNISVDYSKILELILETI